jgi:hypothetical protein
MQTPDRRVHIVGGEADVPGGGRGVRHYVLDPDRLVAAVDPNYVSPRPAPAPGAPAQEVAGADAVAAAGPDTRRAEALAREGRLDEARAAYEEAQAGLDGPAADAVRLRIEGIDAVEDLRRALMERSGPGDGRTVYLHLGGRPQRATLIAATDRGVTARMSGLEMTLPWQRVRPDDLAAMALAYAGTAGERLAAAKLLMACGDATKARAALEGAGLASPSRVESKEIDRMARALH